MATQQPDRTPAACPRCGHQPLHYVAFIPKPYDQPSPFTVYRCETCGHLVWEAQDTPPEKP